MQPQKGTESTKMNFNISFCVISVICGLFLSQIVICLIQPILSRWAEDVDIQRSFERLGFVLYMSRNVKHFAGHHVDHVRLIGAYPKSQTALQNISNLLVLV